MRRRITMKRKQEEVLKSEKQKKNECIAEGKEDWNEGSTKTIRVLG